MENINFKIKIFLRYIPHGLVKRFESAPTSLTAKTSMPLTLALTEKNAKEHLINFQMLLLYAENLRYLKRKLFLFILIF